MVDDNIYMFPRAVGPMLRKHHEDLLSQPFPQRLKDLLAMLEEACGPVDVRELAKAETGEPAVPPQSRRDKPE
jgi:hypothetical protein